MSGYQKLSGRRWEFGIEKKFRIYKYIYLYSIFIFYYMYAEKIVNF